MQLERNKEYETKAGTVYKVVHIIDAKQEARYPVVAVAASGRHVRTYALDGTFISGVDMVTENDLVKEHTELAHLCGYTKEQWKFIINGNFLCGFSDISLEAARDRRNFGFLTHVNLDSHEPFTSSCALHTYKYCVPKRQAGIRQPWFGGECPVPEGMMVLVTWRDGSNRYGTAKSYDWRHSDTLDDIVEFISLGVSR